MKIHLHQIPPEGLHLEGIEDRDILELGPDDSIRALEPVSYSLDVGVSENGLFATGELNTVLEFQCVVCLEPFRYPVHMTNFACQTELTGSDTVDLTPVIREDILLALPPHPRCDWNGENECRGTRNASFGTRGEGNESEQQGSNTWAALDQLNIKKDN